MLEIIFYQKDEKKYRDLCELLYHGGGDNKKKFCLFQARQIDRPVTGDLHFTFI